MDMISRRRDVFLGLSQSIFSIKLFFSRVINVSISSVLVLPIIAVGVEFTVPSKRLHVHSVRIRLANLTHNNMPLVQVLGVKHFHGNRSRSIEFLQIQISDISDTLELVG